MLRSPEVSAESGREATAVISRAPSPRGAAPPEPPGGAPLRLAVAGLALAALIAYAVLWLQVSPARERGTDFSASYVAALLIREDHGAQIYDQGVEAARHAAILLPGYRANLPFITPPTTAVLSLPLTLLGPGAAYRLFSLVQLLLTVAAAWVAARAGPWPEQRGTARLVAAGAAVAGTATLPLLLLGQWDGVCALGLALAYSGWRRHRSFSAGLWLCLGFGIAKPHLAVGLLAFTIGRRDGRALLGIATGAAGLIAASLVAVGPGATLGFLGASSFALGNTPPASTLGLLGLAASWLGPGSAAEAAAVVGGALGIAGCGLLGWWGRGRCDRLEVSLAAAAVLSLLVTPHLLAHDLVVLVPALVWLSARAARVDAPRPWPGRAAAAVVAGWLVLALLIGLDAGAGGPAPPGRLVPWGLIAAAALLVVWQRRLPGRMPAEAGLADGKPGV